MGPSTVARHERQEVSSTVQVLLEVVFFADFICSNTILADLPDWSTVGKHRIVLSENHGDKLSLNKVFPKLFRIQECQHSNYSQTRRKCQYWNFCLYYVKTKKSSDKMLPPVGIEPGPLINPRFHPFSANGAFVYKTESLGSLYNHTLLSVLNMNISLKTSSVAHTSLAQKGDSEIRLWEAWVLCPLDFLFWCSNDKKANFSIFPLFVKNSSTDFVFPIAFKII